MRVAVVSDIHGNLGAFRAVLADLRLVAPDLVVHGGDLAYGGTHPAEMIDQIRSLGWPGIRGNTDEMMTVANTGGVSQSYDGDRRASYLVLDGESVTIRRVEYDVENEAKELQSSGLPHADWLSRILLAGQYCPS
jgi:predicted phosphodiesterase